MPIQLTNITILFEWHISQPYLKQHPFCIQMPGNSVRLVSMDAQKQHVQLSRQFILFRNVNYIFYAIHLSTHLKVKSGKHQVGSHTKH